MSKSSRLCANATLWDPTTRAAWGSLDFCPALMWFQIWAIMQTQLTALSLAGAWGEVENPRWDIAFLMKAPSNNAGGDQVFGLTVLQAHSHQGCLFTLVEAAQKLILLADDSPDWLYTFIPMSDTMLHVPLFDNGHIGAMKDGIHSVNTCGHLHQLQAWKLLQHVPWGVKQGAQGSSILFLGAATLECCQWGWTHPRSIHARGGTEWYRIWDHQPHITANPLPAIEPPWDIATILNLHLQGALEQLQQISSVTSAPLSQHSMPGRKLSSTALGAPPST